MSERCWKRPRACWPHGAQKSVPCRSGRKRRPRSLTLKSLQQHDSERIRALTADKEPEPNGIACPECGAELVDPDPLSTYTSYPAQMDVACLKCGWTGRRIA